MKHGIYYKPEENKQMLVYEEDNILWLDYPYTEDWNGDPVHCKFLFSYNEHLIDDAIFIGEL